MGIYIFKYSVNVTQSELDNLGSINIEQRIQRANCNYDIFGKVGCGVPVTDHVFIIRANSYKECLRLILEHKSLIEGSAWQPGTFGEMGIGSSIEKFGELQNKLHTISCKNRKSLTDIVVCYKVYEETAKRVRFYDAMRWAESCIKAASPYSDISAYRNNLVY